jgi:hypothetical protein
VNTSSGNAAGIINAANALPMIFSAKAIDAATTARINFVAGDLGQPSVAFGWNARDESVEYRMVRASADRIWVLSRGGSTAAPPNGTLPANTMVYFTGPDHAANDDEMGLQQRAGYFAIFIAGFVFSTTPRSTCARSTITTKGRSSKVMFPLPSWSRKRRGTRP